MYRRQRPMRGGVGTAEGWLTADAVDRLGLAGGGRAPLGPGGRVLPLDEIPLAGAHNVSNVLAAVAVGLLFGIAPDGIRRAVASFQAVEHHLEPVNRLDGVLYVNDSMGTQPDAVIAALRSFPGPIVLIAGGQDKGVPLDALAREAAERAAAVVLIGESAPLLAGELERAGHRHVERAAHARRGGGPGGRAGTRGDGRRRVRGRHGAAEPSGGELRHVHRLRGARPRVPGRGVGAGVRAGWHAHGWRPRGGGDMRRYPALPRPLLGGTGIGPPGGLEGRTGTGRPRRRPRPGLGDARDPDPSRRHPRLVAGPAGGGAERGPAARAPRTRVPDHPGGRGADRGRHPDGVFELGDPVVRAVAEHLRRGGTPARLGRARGHRDGRDHADRLPLLAAGIHSRVRRRARPAGAGAAARDRGARGWIRAVAAVRVPAGRPSGGVRQAGAGGLPGALADPPGHRGREHPPRDAAVPGDRGALHPRRAEGAGPRHDRRHRADGFLLFFVAGGNLWQFFLLVPAGVAGVVGDPLELVPARADRAFLDPWSDPTGKGLQTIHGLLALGLGGVLGPGWGEPPGVRAVPAQRVRTTSSSRSSARSSACSAGWSSSGSSRSSRTGVPDRHAPRRTPSGRCWRPASPPG